MKHVQATLAAAASAAHSNPLGCPQPRSQNHGSQPGGVASVPQGPGRGPSSALDSPGTEVPSRGTLRQRHQRECEDAKERDFAQAAHDQETQCRLSQEERPPEVLHRRAQDVQLGEQDDRPTPDGSNEIDQQPHGTRRERPSGVREALQGNLPACPGAREPLCGMGDHDGPGEPDRERPTTSTTGALVGSSEGPRATSRSAGSGGLHNQVSPRSSLIPEAKDADLAPNITRTIRERSLKFFGGDAEPDDGHDGDDQGYEGRDCGAQGRHAKAQGASSRGQRQRDRRILCDGSGKEAEGSEPEFRDTVNDESAEYEGLRENREGISPYLSASQKLSQQLSLGKARHLEEQSEGVVPRLLQGLVAMRRTVLLEVACSPESLLTSTVQSLAGDSEAASRCSWWNSGDLSTDKGVRHVMQRLDLESPTHVWISPPSDAFSPLQNLNGRTQQQQDELQDKRQEAMKIIVGACVVFHSCVQRGIHVTLELPEKCQAWRLPILCSLKNKYSLYDTVTHGCRVGLRNSPKEPLLRRGWKVLTTHKRLSEILHLPCQCSKTYVHGRCAGLCINRSELYTQAYARRVAKAVLQEHNACTAVQECQGQTQLPGQFGEGSCCVCKEVTLPHRPRKCGHCLQDSGSTQGEIEATSSEGFWEECFQSEDIQDLEGEARRLLQEKDSRHQSCEQLINKIPFNPQRRQRGILGEQPQTYIVLGVYAFGNHYGVTKRTYQIPHTVRYLMKYLRHVNGSVFTCTSLVINRNAMCPIHKDVNNDPEYLNRLIGLGNYTRGELWVEVPQEQNSQKACRKVLPNGMVLNGHLHATRHRLVSFPPKAWHGPEPWEGQRDTVTSFVSRGWCHVSDVECQELQKLGFILPPPKPQALAATQSQSQTSSPSKLKAQERAKIQKQLYMLHAATGHGSGRSLVEVLKRRNAHPEIVQMAKDFKCSVCAEKSKVQPRHLASLEALPPKWHTVSADIGHWRHPTTGEHVRFMLIIDDQDSELLRF